MFRRILTIVLVAALMSTFIGFQSVQAKAGEEVDSAEKARISVAGMGVGKDARVEVKLRDNTKLKGYVSEVEEDSFTVTDKTGISRTVAYADVAKVSKQGNGWSTGTKAIVGAAVAAGAIIGWIILKPALCDGGAQSRGPC